MELRCARPRPRRCLVDRADALACLFPGAGGLHRARGPVCSAGDRDTGSSTAAEYVNRGRAGGDNMKTSRAAVMLNVGIVVATGSEVLDAGGHRGRESELQVVIDPAAGPDSVQAGERTHDQ